MLAATLLPRLGAKTMLVAGAVIATMGMLLLALIDEDSTWLTGVLPGEIIVSIGLGLVFVPINTVALANIHTHDTGVASAIVNTTQQLGGALGTALLNTIFATAVINYTTTHPRATDLTASANLTGYRTVFIVAAALFGLGALTAAALMRNRDDLHPNPHADDDQTGAAAPSPATVD